MQEPDIVKRDAKAYYNWLRSQRIPGAQAYQMTIDRFGSPKTPDEAANDQREAAENAGLYQAGGAIGGALLAREAYAGFPNVREAFSSTPTTSPQSFSAQPVGAAATATPGTQAMYNAGANAASATPQVISSEGGMSTVQTPVGTQQVPTESLNDSSFWNSVDWGQVAQGGLALTQMYGAYKSFKSGDKAGGAINMAAGAGNLAAATGAVATGAGAGTMGATVIPGLNILAAGYTGYKTAEALSDAAAGKQRDVMGVTGGAAAGAGLGTAIMPGIGTAIGAAVGALAGYAGSKFGSSKRKPQMMRDSIRGTLQKGGILDENFQGTLADGSTYDFGKDGSTLKWKNIDKIAEAQPKAWNAAVPAADALAASYGFVGQKASDIAAWYAKGAVSNAGDDPKTALSNMQHFAKQQGISMDLVKSKLDEALQDNRITQDKYNYYMNGANQLLGGAGAAASSPAITRPEKGKVGRQSAGLYRDDQGKLVKASSTREALERAYKKTEGKGKDQYGTERQRFIRRIKQDAS